MATGRSFKLNTGATIPAVGLGTWKAEPGKVGEALKVAIDAGYRHIDGAWAYDNEKEVGDALAEIFKQGKVKREDLFYTSKLWNKFHKPADVQKAIAETLGNLRIGYLDLYLVHWPVSFDGDKKTLDDKSTITETWRAMEKLVDEGKVRAIGVANFPEYLLQDLLSIARIKPAVNQVELHPHLPQPKLLEYCKKEGIHLTAYSPLGSGKGLLDDPVVKEVAKKTGKDAGQVLISWGVARGTSVIPKSTNPDRIRSNFQDFELSPEDIKTLDSIKTHHRTCDPKEFWGIDLFKDGEKGNL
ncbi:hypothetical protein HK104_004421 [Borealophlyctis nickersoniae]|nr:hypothetical protein HK104_004421 [Borealophlyctis nickersoniae]